MIKVNRPELLAVLESLQPGLSIKDTIEQSSCFVFMSGWIHTFNDEVACSRPFDMEGLEGAVQSKPLMELLAKMPEETITIRTNENELRIKGKRRDAGIRMENEVRLPIEMIEEPGEDDWVDLPTEFGEALGIVRQSASKNEDNFAITCIHIHPKRIESTDNYQATRFKMNTKFPEPVLIRQDSALHIGNAAMTMFALTKNWLHFVNEEDMQIACRKYMEEYPSKEMRDVFKVEGTRTILPEGIESAVLKAEIFSSDSLSENAIKVVIESGWITLKGIGSNGWYSEKKRLEYDGPNMSFQIAPKLFTEISKKHHECEISESRLKIDGGRFEYVVCLEIEDE